MARIKRIYFPDTLYHVFNRGVEKKDIFKDEEDRIKFLNILDNALKKFNFKIYAYVLMPNHYHILLKDIQGDLPQIMKYIGENYAMYFNWKYKRIGHLYQGRYKSIIVEKEIYLKEVIRYIILNPIRAGLVNRLSGYKWSSYYEYIGKNKRYKITEKDWFLNQFSPDKESSIVLLKKYLSEKDDVTEKIIEESLMNDFIFGTDEFKKKIAKKIKSFGDAIQEKIVKTNVSQKADEIISNVKKKLKTSEIEIKKKKGKNNYAKKIAIYLIRSRTNYSLEEIGKIFNMHPASISREIKSIKNQLKQNEFLRNLLVSI